jgi:hypothetical protein
MSEWEDVLDYVPKEALDGDHVNGTDEIKLTHRMNKVWRIFINHLQPFIDRGRDRTIYRGRKLI